MSAPTLYEAILQHECPAATYEQDWTGYEYRLYVIRLHCLDVVVMTEGWPGHGSRIAHLSYEDQGYLWNLVPTSNYGMPEVQKGKLLRECEHCGGVA